MIVKVREVFRGDISEKSWKSVSIELLLSLEGINPPLKPNHSPELEEEFRANNVCLFIPEVEQILSPREVKVSVSEKLTSSSTNT